MRSVFEYISYRLYLKDFYEYKKEYCDGFSYRSFASDVGTKSVNYLQWIIEGTRNITAKLLPAVIKAIGFETEEEEHYFSLLVSFDQAKSQLEKDSFFQKITEVRLSKKVTLIEEKRYECFSDWATVAIKELLNVKPFNPKIEDGYYKLGAMLRPRISKVDARKAVKTLMSLGIIEQEPDGTLQVVERQITTGNEAPGFYIRQFHRQMLERAADSMDIFPSESRDISAMTMSISVEAQNSIKKAIQDCRKEITSIISEDSNPERVVQLNFQLFPLAEIPNE